MVTGETYVVIGINDVILKNNFYFSRIDDCR